MTKMMITTTIEKALIMALHTRVEQTTRAFQVRTSGVILLRILRADIYTFDQRTKVLDIHMCEYACFGTCRPNSNDIITILPMIGFG
jgi:hypothetical protein